MQEDAKRGAAVDVQAQAAQREVGRGDVRALLETLDVELDALGDVRGLDLEQHGVRVLCRDRAGCGAEYKRTPSRAHA